MMGSPGANLDDVLQLVHLAVAPIFLLTGVATTLLVFSGRLARIVDRARLLEAKAAPDNKFYRKELLLLDRRARLIYRALTLGVSAAILVCLLMTFAFVGKMCQYNLARAVAGLFIAALFSYTGALTLLLREVFLAVGNFRLGIHNVADSSGKSGESASS